MKIKTSRTEKQLSHKQFRKRSELPDEGLPRKKKALGQNFLRKTSTVINMIDRVAIKPETTVFEIGCGDGFLTEAILRHSPCKKLVCYEIDPEWAEVVRKKVTDSRLEIRLKNILEVDFATLAETQPWVLLANLPYQITFPIMTLLQKHKDRFQEGVVMVQEEVAQKLVAQSGRSMTPVSLFFQHHFDLELMEKVEPGAFNPPPKVNSRLVYFRPKQAIAIPAEEEFWKFLKLCFLSPRQTLNNNLRTTHYKREILDPELLKKRAQELSFAQFLTIWQQLQTEQAVV